MGASGIYDCGVRYRLESAYIGKQDQGDASMQLVLLDSLPIAKA